MKETQSLFLQMKEQFDAMTPEQQAQYRAETPDLGNIAYADRSDAQMNALNSIREEVQKREDQELEQVRKELSNL